MRKVVRRRTDFVRFLLCAVLIVSAIFAFGGCNKKEEKKEFIHLEAIFTDNVTGEEYRVNDSKSISFVYDGEEHTYAYKIVRENTDEVVGESGTVGDPGGPIIVKDPGDYSLRVISRVNGFDSFKTLIIKVEEVPKLQPIMKFYPNGAIEWTDGEYYKYKYTDEYCYPIAYAEYEGKRLETDTYPLYLIEGCDSESGIITAVPKQIGKYRVRFAIVSYLDDPNLDIYYSVRKTVTVEIVE